MAETVLLIDQGNTRLKWVLARNGEIDEKSAGHGDFGAFSACFGETASARPKEVLISSVASREDSDSLAGFCHSCWGLEAQLLKSGPEKGGVRNAYEEPAALGVDRWLAIVGAVARYGKPVVIWDLGTAATLDAVDASGQHLGGLIYPGPATMLASLVRDTQLRVPPDLERSASAPGKSTAHCIANGVYSAQVGALNQFLRHSATKLGGDPALILTGGAAPSIMPLLGFDCIHDPWLVFRGMVAG
jgi:type III pantothenate kinase